METGKSFFASIHEALSLQKLMFNSDRCTRNCYLCPICTALLVVIPINPAPASAASEAPVGPFTLYCNHCHWTIGEMEPSIQLDKPTSISAQLGKMISTPEDIEFARLKQHYTQQLGNAQEDFTNSPAALTRLMGLYTGLGNSGPARRGRGVKKLEMKEIDRPREVVEEKEMELVERLAKQGLASGMESNIRHVVKPGLTNKVH